jgi:hypothetical protein
MEKKLSHSRHVATYLYKRVDNDQHTFLLDRFSLAAAAANYYYYYCLIIVRRLYKRDRSRVPHNVFCDMDGATVPGVGEKP